MDIFALTEQIRDSVAEPAEVLRLCDEVDKVAATDRRLVTQRLIAVLEAGNTGLALEWAPLLELTPVDPLNGERLDRWLPTLIEKDPHAVADLLRVDVLEHMLNEDGEHRCGALVSRCPNRECPYKFPTTEDWFCAECGTMRRLCRQKPEPNGRCRHHGGGALTGPYHAHYKDGRFSKYATKIGNKSLAEHYDAVRGDSEYLRLQDDIELMTAYIRWLVAEMPEEYLNVGNRHRVSTLLERFKLFDEEGDAERALNTAKALLREITVIVDGDEAMNQVMKAQEHKRKMAETETKMKEVAHKMFTIERVMQLMNFSAETTRDVLEKHIDDQQMLYRIFQDLSVIRRRIISGSRIGGALGNAAGSNDNG